MAAPVCVFENPEFGMVRMATDEKGEPWFCAKDLCDALGYKRADNAVRQHVNLIVALKQYRLYHSNDTASLAWLQVSLFTWLAIPV